MRFRRVMPVPVRALWEGATEEERKRAHETCATILELWVGKATKAEAAARLEVPPLRVWQLSQQALAGMVAGLLKQPRSRKALPGGGPEDPSVLGRRLAELERESQAKDALIALLRDLPAHREAKPREGAGRPHAPRRRTPRERPGADRADAPGGTGEARGP